MATSSSLTSPVGVGADLRAVVDGVLKGKTKVVNFDVSSSRYFTLFSYFLAYFCFPGVIYLSLHSSPPIIIVLYIS
jgi:hypothetical protein